LIELHGGTVRAESDGAGKGATFIVRVPLLITEEKKLETETRRVPAFDPGQSESSVSLNDLRILIVDDEEDARELVSTMLARAGAVVQAASSAGEALTLIESWKPEVLIADIGMQGEDGYDLIRKVRALPEDQGGNIPAIALTAYARIEDRKRALSSGFQVHLAKPVDRTQLAVAVSNLVSD
jgi:CheY-like chemotaxis protein